MTMISKIKSALDRDDRLLRHGLFIAIGGMIGSAFNYIYQILMGRLLGPADYGIFGGLFAVIYVITVTSGSVMRTVSLYSSRLKASGKQGQLASFVRGSIARVALLSAAFLAAGLLVSPWIAGYLHVRPLYAVMVILVGLFSLILSLFIGLFNGVERFKTQALLGVANPAMKLALGAGLVLLGYGIFGAVSGLALAGLLAVLLAAYLGRRVVFFREGAGYDFSRVYRYFFPVTLASFLLIFLVNIDIIMVRHYFPAQDSGFYNAAANIGRIIWFGSGMLAVVLFPKIAKLTEQKKSTSAMLRQAVLYTALVSGAGSMLYFIIPNFISRVVYGSGYAISAYLGLMGLAYGFYSLSALLATYEMALQRFWFSWVLAAGIIVEAAGIFVFHSSIPDVIKIVLTVNILVFVSMLIAALRRMNVGR